MNRIVSSTPFSYIYHFQSFSRIWRLKKIGQLSDKLVTSTYLPLGNGGLRAKSSFCNIIFRKIKELNTRNSQKPDFPTALRRYKYFTELLAVWMQIDFFIRSSGEKCSGMWANLENRPSSLFWLHDASKSCKRAISNRLRNWARVRTCDSKIWASRKSASRPSDPFQARQFKMNYSND